MVVKVVAFTGSKTVSSRRFRLFQYISYLKAKNLDIKEHYSYFGSWPPKNLFYRPLWLILTILDRIIPVIQTYSADITFFQREMVSTLLTLERFTKRPRILDVDDAIWLQGERAFNNFINLVKICDGVICGNQYIFDSLSKYNSNCIIIPTSVDTKRFAPENTKTSSQKIIGWSGLSSGYKFLYEIEESLNSVLDNRSDVILRIVSDAPPDFQFINKDKVEYIKWSPENEVETIQSMTIGIMPLDDTEWSKGKCSYKMLLYMSCALPVVVSNYGMNIEVLEKGKVGFGASSLNDWEKYLNYLLDNSSDAILMGKVGRKIIEDFYSIESNSTRLANFITTVSKK